jgi:hypothetical protein
MWGVGVESISRRAVWGWRGALAVLKRPERPRRIHHDPKTRRRRLPPLLSEKDPKTRKRRNLGTFATRAAAEKHERAVQYFKHH